jgi:hypothetical protein
MVVVLALMPDDIERLTGSDLRKDTQGGDVVRHRARCVAATLLVMTVIGAAAGNVVAADRTVLMEYFNATW